MTAMPESRSKRERRGPFLFIVGAWALAVIAVIIWWSVSPDEHANGTCTGIGFGCTPSPKDTIVLLGLFYGLPLSLGWWVVGVITTVLINRSLRISWWLRGIISLGICLAIVVAAAAVIAFAFSTV